MPESPPPTQAKPLDPQERADTLARWLILIEVNAGMLYHELDEPPRIRVTPLCHGKPVDSVGPAGHVWRSIVRLGDVVPKAVGMIHLVDGICDSIGGPKWQGRLADLLKMLNALNVEYDGVVRCCDVGGEMLDDYIKRLTPIMEALRQFRRELQQLWFTQAAVTKRPKPQRKRKTRAKRTQPTVEMMGAYESHGAGLSYRAIGKERDKSPETIRRWVLIVGEWYGDSARSLRVRHSLPTDRRGGAAL